MPQLTFSQQYLWPTDSGRYLSSTFGETRSSHFHAGLDIKTWGREGYRVFASRDGFLYRLLVTERGYGNAIYLKHSDGTFTVYAHLQRFHEDLQTIADSIRLPDHSFEMDAILDSLRIPVKQGQVIGFTGSTGIGPPHLHFEVRDSLDNPINALTTNLSVRDDLPPVFSTLLVEPTKIKSTVDGQPVSGYFRPASNEGVYDFGIIPVSGEVGVAVDVFDRANRVNNAYAVHSLALIHEGDTLFYEELNEFRFGEEDEMYLDRVQAFGTSRRSHQRLYTKDGQNNPFYLITDSGARMQPGDTLQQYSIIARDYFGNSSTATFTLIRDSISVQESLLPIAIPRSEWYWHEDWASPDLHQVVDLEKGSFGLNWKKDQQWIAADSSEPYMLSRIIPDNKNRVISPDYRFWLKFPSQAFFDTLSIASSYTLSDDGPILSVEPAMIPARKEFRVEFFMGDLWEEGNRYRLFRLDTDDGDLSYVDSEMIGKTVIGYPSGLGTFTIQADNESPELSDVRIYQTSYGRWKASVHISDALSGVESSNAEFRINGIQGIAEYDYEEETLSYYHPDFTPSAQNDIQIKVSDKAGNTTVYNTQVAFPKP